MEFSKQNVEVSSVILANQLTDEGLGCPHGGILAPSHISNNGHKVR